MKRMKSNMDKLTLYHQIGRIIASAPEFLAGREITQEQMLWIGRAEALIKETDLTSWAEFRNGYGKLNYSSHDRGVHEMFLALHKALGAAELAAPSHARGSFIPAGNEFDAFSALTKLFDRAKSEIFVVDPYMDEKILVDFLSAISRKISIRLLSDSSCVKTTLKPATLKWHAQYGDDSNLEVRLAPERTLHDRAVFLDHSAAWTLTQSIKDFAGRSPAEIVDANDTASLKISAYEKIWSESEVIR